jgi:hypothetical protein
MGYGLSSRERHFLRLLSSRATYWMCIIGSSRPFSEDGNVWVRAVHEFSLDDILISSKRFDEKLGRGNWLNRMEPTTFGAHPEDAV